jgi:hypothetical protein
MPIVEVIIHLVFKKYKKNPVKSTQNPQHLRENGLIIGNN